MANSKGAAVRPVAAAVAITGTAPAGGAEGERKFLADIQSQDAGTRHAAWSMANQMDARVIPELSRLLLSERPGVRKAAGEALNHIVHSAGKEPGGEKRRGVVARLLELLDDGRHHAERVAALRHLSLIAESDAVPAIARLVHHPALREEVVFCLERIPGKTAEAALLEAMHHAVEGFQPRILAALGHRRAEEAAGLARDAMRSADRNIAVAAMKAFARIGARPGGPLEWPRRDLLSDWERIEAMDSLLRYADAQRAKGNLGEAWPIYREALGRPEEHWQCAAIIAIARIGTPEAAAALFPKLRSDQRNVRITARRAWDSMKG